MTILERADEMVMKQDIETLQQAIGGLGATELLVIFGIVVLLFGGSKLPILGKSLGEGINNFKKSFKDDDDVQVADVQVSEVQVAEVQVAEVSSTTEVGTDASKPAPELENQPSSSNEG